jgi:hypothetical protein
MSRRIITLGMDVHKESITLAVLPEHASARISAGFIVEAAAGTSALHVRSYPQ